MKKYFITGLVLLLPTVLTLMIVIFLFDFFTTPFVPLVRSTLNQLFYNLPEEVILFCSRLIGLVLLVILILILGFLTNQFIFKSLIKYGNKLLSQIPLINTVYKLSRDIFTAIFSPDGKQAFKETVMVPFPQKPHYSLGYSSGETPEECETKTGKKLTPIFVPTAPHPISGFLFLVPQENIHYVKMSKEDAFKYLVSCGVFHPDTENPHDHL